MATAYLNRLAAQRWRGLLAYEVTTDTTPDDFGPMGAPWSSFEPSDDRDAQWSFMWQSEAERIECLAIDVAERRRTLEAVMKDLQFRRYAHRIAKEFRSEEDLPDCASTQDVIALMVRRIWERRLLPTSDHTHYGVFLPATKAALLALSRLPLPEWVRVVDQTKSKNRVLVALPAWARMADVKSHVDTGKATRAGLARKRAREQAARFL